MKFLSFISAIGFALACFFGIAYICSAFVDAYRFHEILKGDYETPWYKDSFLNQPYTVTYLSRYPSKNYITTNAIGSQIWLVKEVVVGNKTFWTCLKRTEIENPEIFQ